MNLVSRFWGWFQFLIRYVSWDWWCNIVFGVIDFLLVDQLLHTILRVDVNKVFCTSSFDSLIEFCLHVWQCVFFEVTDIFSCLGSWAFFYSTRESSIPVRLMWDLVRSETLCVLHSLPLIVIMHEVSGPLNYSLNLKIEMLICLVFFELVHFTPLACLAACF